MRTPPLFFSVLAALLLTLGCQTKEGARVLRMLQDTNAHTWKVSVNAHMAEVYSSENELKLAIEKLRVGHGDLVLIGSSPSHKAEPSYGTWNWILKHCDSNHVAVYLYGVYNTSVGSNIFSMPVLHWESPYDDPANVGKANYYMEGRFLGKGSAGYHKMMANLLRDRPEKVFLLGSQYDRTGSGPPLNGPYVDDLIGLTDRLNAAGVKLIVLESQLGF